MATKSSSKSLKTGPSLSVEDLYAIDGPHAQPVMLAGVIARHYCPRIQKIGKCSTPCAANELCVKNVRGMMTRLANARNRAALLTWLCREFGEKEIDLVSDEKKFEYTVDDFGQKSGAELDWSKFLHGG